MSIEVLVLLSASLFRGLYGQRFKFGIGVVRGQVAAPHSTATTRAAHCTRKFACGAALVPKRACSRHGCDRFGDGFHLRSWGSMCGSFSGSCANSMINLGSGGGARWGWVWHPLDQTNKLIEAFASGLALALAPPRPGRCQSDLGKGGPKTTLGGPCANSIFNLGSDGGARGGGSGTPSTRQAN